VNEWEDWPPGDDLPDGEAGGFGGLDPSLDPSLSASLDPSLEPEPVAGLEPQGTSGFGAADEPDLDEDPLEEPLEEPFGAPGEPAPLDYGDEPTGTGTFEHGTFEHGDSDGFDGQEHLEHLQHVEHMEHVQHVQHVQHVEHLEHLERIGEADTDPTDTDPTDTDPTDTADTADEPPVGADPDLDPHGDEGAGAGDPFPEPLALGEPPEPVDGFPWTDARLIGGDGVEPLADLADPATAYGSPPAGDLYAYAGEDAPDGVAGWADLIASPDPATSTLARFWSPAP
jgi:hypothetical protein